MARDTKAWLEDLGLERYADTFAEHEIDLAALPHLSEDDLKEIGLALGARRKVLAAIAELSAAGAREDREEGPSAAPARPRDQGEQRQVSVLFADIAGFTPLSGELGGEATHSLLNRYFETVDAIIEAYGGSVDKHIGDNVMAVFGAPVAHANDPERALRAALDIHRAMTDLSSEFGRTLEAHIGIASGKVVASGTGSKAHLEYTVTGASVNLAARLQETAAPGETLISQAVQRSVADIVESEPVGEIAVKGFDEPITAWKLLDVTSDSHAGRRGPLAGRRSEQRQFEALLEACLDSGTGQVVLVRGEAGIGKTRLLEVFADLAERKGFSCHMGLVLDFGAGKGQDPVRAIVRSLLGIRDGAGKAERGEAADRAIESAVIEEDLRVYLNDLLNLPQPSDLGALYDAMDNTTRNAGKQKTVARLIEASSARQPIMVSIEDIHWADPLTLDHLANMTAAVAACPAVLVMTSRVEGDPLDKAWRATLRASPLTTIDLHPLRPEEAKELASGFAASESAFVRDCIARAEGNPLFLEQLLRNAAEGFVEEVPDSIQSLVLARMDRLEPRDKDALQAAAVIGQRFSLEALRAVLGDEAYDCASLIEHYLIRPAGPEFLFAHALIQECVYASLLGAQRRELHRQAADWFAERDAVLHAEHLDRAGDAAAPKAYLNAARQQAQVYHYERAIRLVERGLAITEEAGARWALTCLHGDLLHDTGRIEASSTAYRDALEIAQDDGQRVRAWIGLAADMRMLDDYQGALEILEKAEKAAEANGLTRELSQIHHLRGNLYFPLGRIEACREEHERALERAREAEAPDCEAQALGGLADAAYAQGRMATAHRYIERCAEFSQAHGLGRSAVAYLAMLGHADFYLCEFRRGIEVSEKAVRLAERVGHYRAEAVAHRCVIHCAMELCEYETVRHHWQKSHDIIARHRLRRFEPIDLFIQAALAEHDGAVAEARDMLEKAVEICRETGESLLGPWVIGSLALLVETPERARDLLREGERILEAGSVGHNHLWFYRCAIEASLKHEDWREAARYADRMEAYTAAEPLPWSDFYIRWGRALVAWGRKAGEEAELAERLNALKDEAERLGIKTALPRLEAALEGA